MAGAFVSIVLDANRGNLDPSATLVLVVLADHANAKEGGTCWPSKATIGARAGLSERQVQTHLQSVAASGFVERLDRNDRGNVGGRGNSARFKLRLDVMLDTMPDEKGAAHFHELTRTDERGVPVYPGSLPPGFAPKCGSAASKRGSAASETWRQASPEPEVNRNKEPGPVSRKANPPPKRRVSL